MSLASWSVNNPRNPFKFSKSKYAPTISSDNSKLNTKSIPTTTSSSSSSSKSTSTVTRNLHHIYYNSVESIPSSASIPPLLPSNNLNPPKIKQTHWYKSPIFWIKLSSITLLIILFILSLRYNDDNIFSPYLDQYHRQHQQSNHDRNWHIALFCILLFLSILLMFPPKMLIIDGVMMMAHDWGKAKGIFITFCIVWSVNVIASAIAYFYGRFLMKNIFKSILEKVPKLNLTENAIFGDENGWKFVMLLRLLPLNSYDAINYILGCTSLNIWSLIVSGLGMMMNCLLYCLIGVFWRERMNEIFYILMIVELILCIVPMFWWILWIYYNASKEYDDAREAMHISKPEDIFKRKENDHAMYIIDEMEDIC